MKITIKRAGGHGRSIFLFFWNLWSVFYLIHKPQLWQSLALNWCKFWKEIAFCAPSLPMSPSCCTWILLHLAPVLPFPTLALETFPSVEHKMDLAKWHRCRTRLFRYHSAVWGRTSGRSRGSCVCQQVAWKSGLENTVSACTHGNSGRGGGVRET